MQIFKQRVIAVLLVCLVFASIFYSVYSPDLTYDTTLEQGSMTTEATYIIFQDSSTYYARNGETGAIDYSTTNCSDLVQTLHDVGESGVHIHFKHGVFLMDSTVSITKTIRISGEGAAPHWTGTDDSTTLELTANTSMFLYNHTSHVFVGTFENILFNGGNMTETESVVYWENNLGVANIIKVLGNVSDLLFDHVAFFNCGTEPLSFVAAYGNVWNIWIQNCWIEENFGAGIGLMSYGSYSLERVVIKNNHFYDNTIDILITDDGCNDIIIMENTSELTRQNFIRTYNSGRDITASNNLLYDGGCESTGYSSSAFWLNETDHSIFSDNIVKNLENDTAWEIGFYLTKSDYNIFADNQIYNLTSTGIYLSQDSDWNNISGGIVENNDVNGVDINDSDCNYNLVVGVTAEGNVCDIEDDGTNTEIHSCWNGTSWIT